MTIFVPENCLSNAMNITDEDDAKQYLKEYINYIQKSIDNDPERKGEDAEKTAKGNIGYFAGNYSDETRERVERLFECEHPFFGSIKKNGPISAKDAFEIGKRLATKVLRKSKIKKINKNN